MGIVGILLIVLGIYVFNSGSNEMLKSLSFGIGGACAALGFGSFIQAILVSEEYLLPAVGLIVFELLLIIILSNHYSKTI